MQIFKGAVSESPLKELSAKKRIIALDFIRAVCALGIVIYHVSSYSSDDAPKLLYSYANGTLGRVYVGVFLLMSGFVLHYNYKEIPSLKNFYYKRWKSVFPMFYIAWLYFYIQNVILTGKLFYSGNPLKLILTVFGLDGYLLYRVPNYYIVGEWFLGAIVILYAAYPLLLKAVNKWGFKTLILMVPLWLFQVHTDIFEIYTGRNIIYCCGFFLAGMLIEKYSLYKKNWLKIAALPVSLVLLFVPIPVLDWEKVLLLVISMFFLLFLIGEWIMKLPVLGKMIAFVGGISFPIYLVQNKVGAKIVSRFVPTTLPAVIKVVLVAVVLCIIYAWCISTLSGGIQNTGWFKKIDDFFLKSRKKSENKE